MIIFHSLLLLLRLTLHQTAYLYRILVCRTKCNYYLPKRNVMQFVYIRKVYETFHQCNLCLSFFYINKCLYFSMHMQSNDLSFILQKITKNLILLFVFNFFVFFLFSNNLRRLPLLLLQRTKQHTCGSIFNEWEWNYFHSRNRQNARAYVLTVYHRVTLRHVLHLPARCCWCFRLAFLSHFSHIDTHAHKTRISFWYFLLACLLFCISLEPMSVWVDRFAAGRWKWF